MQYFDHRMAEIQMQRRLDEGAEIGSSVGWFRAARLRIDRLLASHRPATRPVRGASKTPRHA